MTESLVTIEDAAKELGVKPGSLRTAAENHGYLVRMGRAVRLEKDRLGELIKKCRVQPKEQGSINSNTAPDQLWRGAIIGTVEIVDVVKDHSSPWFFGPRGLILRNPKPCLPAPVVGALGLFNWQERRTDVITEPAAWMRPAGWKKPEPQGSLL